jgi:multimeric flavodoxin WrbA
LRIVTALREALMTLKAVFVNCTLKRSPEVSNTEALCRKVIEWFDTMDVESEVLRVVDYRVLPGVTSDEGEGDEWPRILERIKAADILVLATPIWFGVRSSVAQQVIERLDGTYQERNEQGQYPLYNKVAGVVVTGNEDGAHAAAETTLFNLCHLGCAIPPNADTYWVGDAGPGPSYIEVGEDSAYTQRTTRWMAHNLVHLARILKDHPIPAEGNTFDDEVEHAPHIG